MGDRYEVRDTTAGASRKKFHVYDATEMRVDARQGARGEVMTARLTWTLTAIAYVALCLACAFGPVVTP